jgi:ADP-heptose:LPS heptosyltransferase
VTCDGCRFHDPIEQRILIIKLDAIGDVLRTTSLLQPLKAKYPRSEVTWITRSSSLDLFANNPLVDRRVAMGADAILLLATKEFDVVINPDTSEESIRLATLARGRKKVGYIFDDHGVVQPLNDAAEAWYQMGQNDSRKRSNTRTYQSILLDICELPEVEHPILWYLSADETSFARAFADSHGLCPGEKPALGLNTGAGGRWVWKKWTLEGYSGLIRAALDRIPGVQILLYGGPDESERNARLKSIAPDRIVDTGAGNTLREFGALVSLCDVMVTGDTLGMHVATALAKRTIVLFGPTSAAEIELYDRGVKVLPEGMDCLCCYLSDCDVRPACMQRIDVDRVFTEVARFLEDRQRPSIAVAHA